VLWLEMVRTNSRTTGDGMSTGEGISGRNPTHRKGRDEWGTRLILALEIKPESELHHAWVVHGLVYNPKI
jgi:hypothetical protein